MVQHFGYRMRYNKLTEPDAKVDRDLMQREFNSMLKRPAPCLPVCWMFRPTTNAPLL